MQERTNRAPAAEQVLETYDPKWEARYDTALKAHYDALEARADKSTRDQLADAVVAALVAQFRTAADFEAYSRQRPETFVSEGFKVTVPQEQPRRAHAYAQGKDGSIRLVPVG